MNKITFNNGKWLILHTGQETIPHVGDIVLTLLSDDDFMSGFAGCFPVETQYLSAGEYLLTGLKNNSSLGYSPLEENYP